MHPSAVLCARDPSAPSARPFVLPWQYARRRSGRFPDRLRAPQRVPQHPRLLLSDLPKWACASRRRLCFIARKATGKEHHSAAPASGWRPNIKAGSQRRAQDRYRQSATALRLGLVTLIVEILPGRRLGSPRRRSARAWTQADPNGLHGDNKSPRSMPAPGTAAVLALLSFRDEGAHHPRPTLIVGCRRLVHPVLEQVVVAAIYPRCAESI